MRWPYFVSLFALLGAGLLLFFNILCGASTSSVLGKWYWLEAGTSSIPGAHPLTRWTNYNSCGVENGRNTECTSSSAAYPMSPVSNFGTTEGVPSGLTSRHGSTYYLSKTGWAFLLIGLFFTLLALVPVCLSFCLPSLSVLSWLTPVSASLALLFVTLSACLLTAGYVKARNSFRDAGEQTHLGQTMLGFLWASVALLVISTVLNCVGSFVKGGDRHRRGEKRYSENYVDTSSHDTYGNNYVQEKQKRRGFFSTRKNTAAPLIDEEAGPGGFGTTAAGLGAAGAAGAVTGAAVMSARDNNYTRETTNKNDLKPGTVAAGAGPFETVPEESTIESAPKGNSATGTDTRAYTTSTGDDLENVAMAAGFGASGATSDYSKKPPLSTGVGEFDDAGGKRDTSYNITHPPHSKLDSATGQDLDDVARAAGYGASGATSDLTKPGGASDAMNKSASGYTASSQQQKSITGPAPYDNSKATGISAETGTSSMNVDSGEHMGLWATAAAALGFGGAAAAGAASHDSDGQKDTSGISANQNDTPVMTGVVAGVPTSHYGADSGVGATHAGANADEELKRSGQYENKSTVLPVGGANQHVTRDEYGNETRGYHTGVPDNAAATAATAASGSGSKFYSASGYHAPMKPGAASSVEDTYKKTAYTKKGQDLTDTTDYEPTEYYSNTAHDEFSHKGQSATGTTAAAAAGVGAVGSGIAGLSMSEEKSKQSNDPELERVARSAGYGASGATSDYTKNKSSSDRELKARRLSADPELEKIGAAVGYGATNAPSDVTEQDLETADLKNSLNKAVESFDKDKLSHQKQATGADVIGSFSTDKDLKSKDLKSKDLSKTGMENVGYAAGLGSSGATSDYTKKSSSDYTKKPTQTQTQKTRGSATAAAAMGSTNGDNRNYGSTTSDLYYDTQQPDASTFEQSAASKKSVTTSEDKFADINVDVSKNRNPITGQRGENIIDTGMGGSDVAQSKPSRSAEGGEYANIPGSFNKPIDDMHAYSRGKLGSNYTTASKTGDMPVTGKQAEPRGLAGSQSEGEPVPTEEHHKGLIETVVEKTKSLI